MVKIKEKPEYTMEYAAIDGIEKRVDGEVVELPIRSDILELFKMSNAEFDGEYNEKKEAAEGLLKQYQLIGSIPALSYGREDLKGNMYDFAAICDQLTELELSLDYLEKLEERRCDYRAANIKTGRELVEACRGFDAMMQIRDDIENPKLFEAARNKFYILLRAFEDRDELVYIVETHADRLSKYECNLVFNTYDRLIETDDEFE